LEDIERLPNEIEGEEKSYSKKITTSTNWDISEHKRVRRNHRQIFFDPSEPSSLRLRSRDDRYK
jgi:hypothetical protein